MEAQSTNRSRETERLDVLISFAKALTQDENQSPGDLLTITHQQVAELAHGNEICIALYNETQDAFHLGITRVEDDRIDSFSDTMRWPPPVTEASVREVFRSLQPAVFISEPHEREGNMNGQPDTQSNVIGIAWLCVPIALGGKSLGVILARQSEQDRQDDNRDASVIQTVAAQLALALDKIDSRTEAARSYELLEREKAKATALTQLANSSATFVEFAHRMSNMAGTIPARVQLLKKDLDPDNAAYQEIVRELDEISRDAIQLLEFAGRLRSVASSANAPEPVDIADAVEAATQRILQPQNVEIQVGLSKHLLPILASREQIVSLVENLIRNGIEAIDGSGTIRVVATQHRSTGEAWVEIAVADTGKGISAKNLTRIFDLFYTTKSTGFGIGLWSAKYLIESLGGTISVASEVGRGTTFTVLLPSFTQASDDKDERHAGS